MLVVPARTPVVYQCIGGTGSMTEENQSRSCSHGEQHQVDWVLRLAKYPRRTFKISTIWYLMSGYWWSNNGQGLQSTVLVENMIGAVHNRIRLAPTVGLIKLLKLIEREDSVCSKLRYYYKVSAYSNALSERSQTLETGL